MNEFYEIMNEIENWIQTIKIEMPEIDEHVRSKYCSIQEDLLTKYHKYSKSYDALENYAFSNTVHIEYASGGESIHRGFYCPSPIIDKLVGNVKRGKLLKQFASRMKNYYQYFFDIHNCLIKVEKYEDSFVHEHEYIINSDLGSISVIFNEMNKDITYISQVINTDDRITFYATLQPDFVTGKQRHFIHLENYHYDNVGMCGATICWEGIPELSLFNEEKYKFDRDEKGSIIGYWLGEEYYNC